MTPSGFDLQGHRGARGLAPENTMPAFRRSLDLGVTTLELDLGVSSDHVLVVSHDPYLSPVFCSHPDGSPVLDQEVDALRLYGMPYAEIARYDCGQRANPRFPRQEPEPAVKPRFADVLAFAEAHAAQTGRPLPFYNVETKSWAGQDGVLHPEPERFVDLIWAEVERAGVAERFTLQSFDVRTLQVARRQNVPVRLALLVEHDGSGTEIQHALDALGFTPDILSPHALLVDADLVAQSHQDGVAVIPWTVNEPDAMRALLALGVDGLITDVPDVALTVLGQGRGRG